MCRNLLSLVVVLAVSMVSFAQQHHVQSAGTATAPVAPATTSCAATYSSGTGQNLTTYCVTVNGTIPQLSRGGAEMLFFGTVDEGYGFCDVTPSTPVAYYDYSWIDSGNLLPSSFSTPTATKAVSVRTTNDGIWQITNTILKVPAKVTGPGQVIVKMTLKNLTGITRSAYVLRHADVDANSDVSNNDFDWTVNNASGQYAPGFSFGLQAVNNTFNVSHNEYTLNDCCAPDPCNPFANISSQPFHGDGSLMPLYFVTVPKGATKSVQITYQPI